MLDPNSTLVIRLFPEEPCRGVPSATPWFNTKYMKKRPIQVLARMQTMIDPPVRRSMRIDNLKLMIAVLMLGIVPMAWGDATSCGGCSPDFTFTNLSLIPDTTPTINIAPSGNTFVDASGSSSPPTPIMPSGSSDFTFANLSLTPDTITDTTPTINIVPGGNTFVDPSGSSSPPTVIMGGGGGGGGGDQRRG